MPFDYSTPPPESALNLIPGKTVALARMDVSAGNVGEDGLLTNSKNNACAMLAYSVVVLAGEYEKRKFFGQFIVEGAPEKYEDQIWRSRRLLKKILQSAFNLDAGDMSQEAKAKLNVGFATFDGLVFYARIGIEPASDDWPGKNILIGAVTKNESDWPGLIQQGPPTNNGGPTSPPPPVLSPAPITRPSWGDKS